MNGRAISLRWNYHLLTAPGYVLIADERLHGPTAMAEKFARRSGSNPLKNAGLEIDQAVE